MKLNAENLPKTCPMHFYDDKSQVLVLEHMGQHGFRDAINKKQGLNLDHAVLVVDWLAKWHGLCHVLMSQHSGNNAI